MSKYLELFKGAFDDSIGTKTKPENKPYIGYSLTDGGMVYTVVPPKNSKIYYTTSDNQLVPTDINMAYNVINHTYENGKGVIEFDSVIDSIPSSAFFSCVFLTSIVIPDSVTSIGSGAFSRCPSLTSITIPNSVTSIGHSAFEGCESLTSITIPNGVTSIEMGTFYDCFALSSIVIPDSVTSIGNETFSGCSSLTSITFEGTMEEWNTIEKYDYYNYEVPATYVQCSDGQAAL